MTTLPLQFTGIDRLIPAIIQDATTKDVLMLGYMNEESLSKTQQTGYVYFYSRRRKRLWKKGETSGNTLTVQSIRIDCDGDTLLVRAVQLGNATCHTGATSCFFTEIGEAL